MLANWLFKTTFNYQIILTNVKIHGRFQKRKAPVHRTEASSADRTGLGLSFSHFAECCNKLVKTAFLPTLQAITRQSKIKINKEFVTLSVTL
jgi:hypothetical protein